MEPPNVHRISVAVNALLCIAAPIDLNLVVLDARLDEFQVVLPCSSMVTRCDRCLPVWLGTLTVSVFGSESAYLFGAFATVVLQVLLCMLVWSVLKNVGAQNEQT